MKRYVIAIIALTIMMSLVCAAACLTMRARLLCGLESMTVAFNESEVSGVEDYQRALFEAKPSAEQAAEGVRLMSFKGLEDYPFTAFVHRLWPNGILSGVGAALAAMAAGVAAFLIIDYRSSIRYKERLAARVSSALRGEEHFNAENDYERHISRLFAEIDRLNKLREESSEELHQYVENVAHELKTPASGIILSLDLMEESGVTKETLTAARGCAMRIGTYVSGLLSLARMRAGKVRFSFEPFRLGALVDEIAADLKANGVAVQKSGSGAVVNGDRVRIKEAIVNLIINSAKHAKAGEPVRVELVSTEVDSSVRICDNGAGAIIPKQIERYSVGSEDGTSSGIGLSLAQVVAKRHSGKLSIRSNENGTQAELIIPIFKLKQSI